MRKKYAILLSTILLSLAAHSCQVPTAVKIKTDKLSIKPPVETGSSNIGGILSKALKDAFPEGFKMYDMVNYTDENGKPVQAFLVNYEMDILDSFNPSDYLGDIEGQVADINQMDNTPGTGDAIDTSINVPSMTPAPRPPELSWFDMGIFYNEVERTLNETSMPPTTSPFPVQKPGAAIDSSFIAGINASVPNLMVMPDSSHTADFQFNFEKIILDGGAIKMRFSLANDPSGPLTDTDIHIEIGVELTGLLDLGNNPITTATGTATLNSGTSFADDVEIDLANTKIDQDHPLKFKITSITNNSIGSYGLVNTKLTIQPTVEGITMRGANGLRIGSMRQQLPANMASAISLSSMPPELINAQIGEGTLFIKATLPPQNGPDGQSPNTTTYSTGLTIGYEIPIKQDPNNYQNTQFPGLGGSTGTLLITDQETDLAGKHINSKTLEIDNNNAYIIITSDPVNGADFELFNNDYYHTQSGSTVQPLTDKKLPVFVEIGMEIKELKLVRWKLANEQGPDLIEQPDPIEIDFGNINNAPDSANAKDISSYIKTITFSDLDIGVDFTANGSPAGSGGGLAPPLQNRLGLVFTCEKLELDQKRALDDGLNSFGFNSSDPARTLTLRDENDQPVVLRIDISLCPVIGYDPDNPPANPHTLVNPAATYLELGPLELNTDPQVNSGETRLDLHGTIKTNVQWSKAQVDLKGAIENSNNPGDSDKLNMLKGTFPGAGEQAIDLSKMSEYLKGGFDFKGIQAKMFLSGPHKLIDKLAPSMIFDAKWQGTDDQGNPEPKEVNLIDNDILKITDDLVRLPDLDASGAYVYTGSYTYAGVDKSENGKSLPSVDGLDISSSGFTDILSAGPAALGFEYEMVMDCVEVTPDMFDGSNDYNESSAIRAQMLLLMPLHLQMHVGSLIELSDMIDSNGKEEDLFGRDAAPGNPLIPKDDLFDGIEINSIGISVSFDDELFNGGKFFIDKNGRLFPNGIDLKGKSLGIAITNEDMDIVRNNIIIPGFKIGFPRGAELAIPREFGLVKMQIDMSGSFTYKF